MTEEKDRGSDAGSPLLSVVIPCRNEASTLGGQLEALAAQEWEEPWEVVIVDDGSTDGSVEIARRFRDRFERLEILALGDSGGPGRARNEGARIARGRYLAFCDADDQVGPGWLAAIGDAVRAHDFVAGSLDRVSLNDPSTASSRGRPGDGPLLSKFGFLPHAPAANLAVRKEIHERAGGFDTDFRAGEDADYCWRIQLAGTPLRAVEDAVVRYRHRSDWRGAYRQAVSWGMADVQLHRRYDPQGMPRLRLWSGIKGWVRLAPEVPRLVNRGGRLRLARKFGYRVGRLKGARAYRYPTL